jgi:predicted lipid-binding transport protein (Tim44 family)
MGSSGFPIDLVLFAMIAGFLVLRLRSILGRRTGYERPPQPYQPQPGAPGAPVIDGRAEAPPAVPSRAVPDPASPLGATLTRMQGVDHGFEPARFLDGAEQAFRMIVEAFAAGNRDSLRNLLSEDTFRGFASAIDAREAAGQTQKTEIKGIHAATIEEADLRGSVASVTVRFVTDQINATESKEGQIVAGTDAVTEITDVWTFERDLSTRDPAWRLVSARSA